MEEEADPPTSRRMREVMERTLLMQVMEREKVVEREGHPDFVGEHKLEKEEE
jgi:hypothetical protein